MELQIDFGAGQFSSLTGPVDITGFSFRAKPGTGPVDATIGSLSVSLSNSPNFPNSVGHPLLSTTFANNVGPDNTLVFSGSNIAVSNPGCAVSGTTPCAFGPNIVFTTPFLYTPGTGPLLMDLSITNFVGISGEWDVESFSAPGGSIADVFGPLGSPTGDFEYGSNITQLTFTAATPEPASYALVLCGLGALSAMRRRRS